MTLNFIAMGIAGFGWGALSDRVGGYAWLYIGSFALGLGAVAIALAFPPVGRQPALRPA